MQEAGFRALGLDSTYELFEVHPDDLPAAVAEKRQRGYAGWNVTVPHKNAMIDLVDEVDPTALLIGSVNTIVNRDGKLHAYSTDGFGLATSIKRSFDVPVAGGTFLFWGCGGAAQATAGYFAANGAASIILVNRTVAKAENLAMLLSQINPDCTVSVFSIGDSKAILKQLDSVDVFIQSTSIGLHPDDPISVPEEL
jgi:shikimate dehydrogenase